ncbi:ribonuclease H-like domain-containing protein [Tanacetum coccineum]
MVTSMRICHAKPHTLRGVVFDEARAKVIYGMAVQHSSLNSLIPIKAWSCPYLHNHQPIGTGLLSRETLPDVKYSFAIIPRQEFHRGITLSSGSMPKPKVTSFVSKTKISNNNKGNKKFDNRRVNNSGNNTVNTSGNNRGPNLNLLCKNCGKLGHTIERCFDIIGYPLGYNKNSSKYGVKSNFNANAELN